MRYRLRYLQHDIDLVDGWFVVGRSADCQLSLDDPLVSRRHARLSASGDEVTIEDLQSRNGVLVNDEPITGRRVLTHGDRIQIGNQRLLLLRAGDDRQQTQLRLPATQGGGSAAGLLSNLADKAFALGRGAEAERILAGYLEGVAADARAGLTVEEQTLSHAAEYAARLAVATGKGKWVDYLVDLYARVGRPLPASAVDGLYAGSAKVEGIDLPRLREYVEQLKERSASFGPSERFLLNRLEGLLRLVALR
ncbi:MAG: FHA domain-containing protein [Polyangiaceae bacterium]|nr:FHA domain-containing protein [Polyangiaceae bacterium]MCW5791602.1 FHA domain-containing protein [Polyangiaceae bacterium]